MQQDIVARLEKLEKKNRFLQRMNFAFMAIFSSAVLIGWTQYSVPKVIEAERFVLKDADGKVKSAWYSDVFKNNDTSYHQSRIEFYKGSDTSIVLGFKRQGNRSLLSMHEVPLRKDSANFLEFGMNLDPTNFNLATKWFADSVPQGNSVYVKNGFRPAVGLSSGEEMFQMIMLDTGMTVERFGLKPEIVYYSNGKDDGKCLGCDAKNVKKAIRDAKLRFMKR